MTIHGKNNSGMGSALAGRNYDMEKDTEVTINEQDQKEEIKKVKKKR